MAKKTFTKYPQSYVKADIDNVEKSRGACYIDNWNKWVRNNYSDVLHNIMDMANNCFAGSGLEVSSPDMISIADNGQITGFSRLYKTMSGNEYAIIWTGGSWKLCIYDDLDANTLLVLAEVMEDFTRTFDGVKFHQDRPII